MKVIFFCRRFYPLIGGVEKHVLEIGKILIAKGYEVVVITENYQSMPVTAKVEGISIVRINAGDENKFKKFRVWFMLLKHLKLISKADIVHCHDIFYWYLPFRFIFPRKKVFTTFHGYEGNKIPGLSAKFMHKLAEVLSFGNICIGSFYKKWYGTNATIISFGAVDKRLIALGNNKNIPTKDAMYIGRLENEAGIMEYLKAIKGLQINLDIYGEGALEKYARRYVKENKLSVNFKGFVANATDYIKDYKFVFVSRYLGILEAFALKKPVFAVYNNDIKYDYLKETPFADYISISGNSTKLQSELKNFKENKTSINPKKSYDWVKDKTWEELVSSYLKLWGKSR
jgi:glycosyltransferase involved in cell wall biosynthesis